MSCKPQYKGKRYNSLKELYKANGVNTQQAQQLYSQYLDTIFPDSKVKDIVYHGITSRLKEKFNKFSKEFIKSGQGRYGEDGFFFSENKEEVNKNYNSSGLITAIINLRNTSGDIYKNTWKETVEYLTEPQEIYGGKTDLDYLAEGYRAAAWYKEGNWKKQVEKLKEDGWRIEETTSSYVKLGKISSQEKTYYSHLKKNLEKGTLPFNVNNSVEAIKKAKEQGLDGLIYENVLEESSIDKHNQYVIFEPEQIHILGSKQDIEGFKQFITQLSTINISQNVQFHLLDNTELEQAETQFPIEKRWFFNTIAAHRFASEINRLYNKVKAYVQTEGEHAYSVRFKAVINSQKFSEGILKKLKALFPTTKVEEITEAIAYKMIGDKAYTAASFIKNDTVYIIENRVNDETLIEEFLHPFIEHLSINNKELYENLLREAAGDKVLMQYIKDNYTAFTVEDKRKELVTQKLAQLLHNQFSYPPTTLEETKILLINLKQAFLKFFQKLLGGTFLNIVNVPPNLTLKQLAIILNTKDIIVQLNYTNTPTFHLIDNIKKDNKDNGYMLNGEVYKDKLGNSYTRLTEWLKETFNSKLKGLTTEDFAETRANSMFKKLANVLNEAGEVCIKLPNGILITKIELIKNLRIDYETGRVFGIIAHKMIQKAVKNLSKENTRELTIEIAQLAQEKENQNEINVDSLAWIDNNINEILKLVNINIGDSRIDADKRDKMIAEITMVFNELGIGTTLDGLVVHSDDTVSIIDWKTGSRFLNNMFTPILLTKFGDQYEEIRDSTLDKAKLEVVIRAMAIKAKNPDTIFRNLTIAHLNKNTFVETYNIHLPSYLKFLEEFYRNEDKQKYEELKKKDLFNPTKYMNKTQTEEDFNASEFDINNLNYRINNILNTIRTTKDPQEYGVLNGKLIKLAEQRLNLLSDNTLNLTGDTQEVGWFKRYLGHLGNVSNNVIQLYHKLVMQQKTKAQFKNRRFVEDFDVIINKLIKEYGVNYKNIGLKYTSKNKTGLYDFLWVEKDKGNIRGYFRITEADNKTEWDQLTKTQKEFINFIDVKMTEQYNIVASKVVHLDSYDRSITNAEISKQPQELPSDFMPRFYQTLGEYIERNGAFSSLKEKATWATIQQKFTKSEVYGQSGEEQILFKGMGSEAIIGSAVHTFNAEIAIKDFMKNLIYKENLDDVHSTGIAIKHYLRFKNLVNTENFLDDRILIEILNKPKKLTKYSRIDLGFIINGRKVEIDVDAILDSLRVFFRIGAMWLKLISGTQNGLFIRTMNYKKGLNGSVASLKALGIKKEDIDMNTEDMLKAEKLYWEYIKDCTLGTFRTNKVFLLLQEFNYLPENYDYKTNKQNFITEKNKIPDAAYFFHSIHEEYGNLTILIGMLNHIKNQKTGKSLLDSYKVEEGKLVWDGGIRGKRKDGSLIKEVTYEEINKLKRGSEIIHGPYRTEERGAIELYALGRWLMMFKKYIATQMINLLQSKQLNSGVGNFIETGEKDKDGISIYEWTPEVVEGRYRIFFKFLIDTVNLGTDKYKWGQLSTTQKQALINSATTTVLMTMMTLVGAAAFDDDDEDKDYYKRYYRLLQDMSSGASPFDMLNNLKSQAIIPMKTAKMLNASSEFLLDLATGKRTKIGDRLHGEVELAKNLPLFNTAYEWRKFFDTHNDVAPISGDWTGLDR